MIPLPSNWSTITANDGVVYEFRVVVDVLSNIQFTFTEADVDSSGFMLERRLFDNWSLGNACAAHLSFVLLESQNAGILVEGQKCTLSVRASYDGAVSGWAQLGVFYIDEVSFSGNIATVSAFDILQKLDNITIAISEGTTLATYASLLLSNYGISLLSTSELLSEQYYEIDATQTGTSQTSSLKQLRYLKLPAKMSEVSAREIISSAAALAGGNAFVDYSENLKFAHLDSTPFYYNPGQINVIAGNEHRGRSTLRFDQIELSGNSNIQSGSGFGLHASVNSNLVVDNNKDVSKLNTADLIRSALLRTERLRFIEGECINISDVVVTPLLDLRDEIAYTGEDGRKHAFGLNGFRLQLSGWCIGELSTQISERDVFLIYTRLYRSSLGWSEPKWVNTTMDAGGGFISKDHFFIESDRTLLIQEPHIIGISSVYPFTRTYRLDGQKITITFAYYYSTNGGIKRDVSFDVYALPGIYLLQQDGNATAARSYPQLMRFIGENIPVDVSWNQPISATVHYEQFTYQYLTNS